jgi:Flp pilus assembly protein TadD
LPGLLERIAESDPLDPKLRQKLALLAAADEDHTAAGRWAWEAIGLNVNDAAMHRLRARALLQSGDTDGAQFHNSIADQLDKPLNFFRQ